MANYESNDIADGYDELDDARCEECGEWLEPDDVEICESCLMRETMSIVAMRKDTGYTGY